MIGAKTMKLWPFPKTKASEEQGSSADKVDALLEDASRIREHAQNTLDQIQAAVDGEDWWFKCYPVERDISET